MSKTASSLLTLSSHLLGCTFLLCRLIAHQPATGHKMAAVYSWGQYHYFCFSFFRPFFQITLRPTGYMRSPREKNAVHTLSIRLSSWRRSFSLICTCLVTVDTKWQDCLISPRDKLKYGSKIVGWRWRNATKIARKTSEVRNYWWVHIAVFWTASFLRAPLLCYVSTTTETTATKLLSQHFRCENVPV